MTAAELSALSDQQLNELVAVEVAGWKLTDSSPWVKQMGYDKTWYRPVAPDGAQVTGILPQFATSADAILPWLSRYHNECINNAGGGWKVVLFDYVPEYHVIAACHERWLPFAKSACIALLLAKGAA